MNGGGARAQLGRNKVRLAHECSKVRGEAKCCTTAGPYVLSGGPLIFLEKKVCILDTFLRESCIYF